jgi:hypothetical protein
MRWDSMLRPGTQLLAFLLAISVRCRGRIRRLGPLLHPLGDQVRRLNQKVLASLPATFSLDLSCSKHLTLVRFHGRQHRPCAVPSFLLDYLIDSN